MDSQTNTIEPTPQLSPSEYVQVHPKRKLNWKGFFIGIIAVILIEIFAVRTLQSDNKQASVYPTTAPTIAKQTSDHMANWKTYTDNILEASFQYPPAWSLSAVRKDPNDSKSENIVFEIEKSSYEVQIWVEDNPQNLDYAEIEKDVFPNRPDLYTNLSFKNIFSDKGITFKEVLIGSAQNGDIIALHNKKLYTLAIGSTIKKPTTNEYNTLEQVARTFKFTN